MPRRLGGGFQRHLWPIYPPPTRLALLSYSVGSAFELDDAFPSSFGAILQKCTGPLKAKQIHAQLLISSHKIPPFLSSCLVSAYSGFGLHADARFVFDAASDHHTSSTLLWNSIIRATVTHGRLRDALVLYLRMRSVGPLPDCFTFPLVVRACSGLSNLRWCHSIHSHAASTGFQYHLHVANELILMYGNAGRMKVARKVFDAMPLRNVVSWNTLISGYSTNCDSEAARDTFRLMESGGPEPNAVTWTTLLSAHSRCRQHEEVLAMFDEMRTRGVKATPEAVAVALSVCPFAYGGSLHKGKQIHGFAISCGFERYPFVNNSLVCMYGKLSFREDAWRIFSEMGTRNLVSWNALISSYAASGFCDEAYEIFDEMGKSGAVTPNVISWGAVIGGFASSGKLERALDLCRQMQRVGVKPNSIIFATVLSTCAELSALRLGREVHAHIIRCFMYDTMHVRNALLNMYTKSGCPRDGRAVFDRMERKDFISWNSMIAGYGMHGLCDEALETFNDMIRAGCKPDDISFIALLSACSHAGRVSEGRHLFDCMVSEYGVLPSMEHYSCMVDLLGRAGFLREADELIMGMPMQPNACVWGALLNSCRIYGNAALVEDKVAQVLGNEDQATGNYMLLSNLYAASGRWKDSARVRVMTKDKGLKKNPGQSWIEVKNKFCVFSAGCMLPPDAKDVPSVLDDLYRQMESEKSQPEQELLMQ